MELEGTIKTKHKDLQKSNKFGLPSILTVFLFPVPICLRGLAFILSAGSRIYFSDWEHV